MGYTHGRLTCIGCQSFQLPWVFSEVIDRESVSPWIVRVNCYVWRNIYDTTFLTDEQNVFSLCPAEGPRNFLAVRIRCVSVLRTHPYMYPRRSTSLDTYSDMYVKDEVLLFTIQCKTW